MSIFETLFGKSEQRVADAAVESMRTRRRLLEESLHTAHAELMAEAELTELERMRSQMRENPSQSPKTGFRTVIELPSSLPPEVSTITPERKQQFLSKMLDAYPGMTASETQKEMFKQSLMADMALHGYYSFGVELTCDFDLHHRGEELRLIEQGKAAPWPRSDRYPGFPPYPLREIANIPQAEFMAEALSIRLQYRPLFYDDAKRQLCSVFWRLVWVMLLAKGYTSDLTYRIVITAAPDC